jgi:UDP-N-acetylglucosamine:LPS N-acetylglucosamine transferase
MLWLKLLGVVIPHTIGSENILDYSQISGCKTFLSFAKNYPDCASIGTPIDKVIDQGLSKQLFSSTFHAWFNTHKEGEIKRMEDQELLVVVELGGYPNFVPLYQRLNYKVEMVNSVRKAQAWLKKHRPQVVVAEFYSDPQFRDRMSNLESLLATLQRYDIEAKIIVLIDTKYLQRLEEVKARYTIDGVLIFPIDDKAMEAAIHRATALR